MINVEIIAIGDELLQGDVLDTNTNWLCRQITGLGGRVQRAVIVPDKQEVIGREIHEARNRQSRLVLTTGGLGPTADDLTLAAVAQATNRPLTLNQDALAIVRTKYKALAQQGAVDEAAITPAREKMAHLPQGATPLDNPMGAAPGVLLEIGALTLVSLPGVPTELKAIFEQALQPTLKAIFGKTAYLEKLVIIDCNDESVLAPILQTVAARHPTVYVKSRAKSFGVAVKFRVTLSTTGASKAAVEQALAEVLHDLEKALSAQGIVISRE